MGNRTQQIAGIDKKDIMNRRLADNYWKKEELKLPDHYRMISAGAFQDNIRIERLLLGKINIPRQQPGDTDTYLI